MHFSVTLAVFPKESLKFDNVLESKEKICIEFKNQRGVYLWTHIKSGNQQIGSSNNLSLRLCEYYRPSYLVSQSVRGSIICKAINKYGQDSFSLSIMILGVSLDKNKINYSSKNLPDYIVMEQNYLDSYTMAYNSNRIASSKYTSST